MCSDTCETGETGETGAMSISPTPVPPLLPKPSALPPSVVSIKIDIGSKGSKSVG